MQSATRLLRLPPVKWEKFCDSHREQLQAIERELDAITEAAARLAAYIGQRDGHGCGDQGHERAVKRCNAAANKVRKAIGYSYPSGIAF